MSEVPFSLFETVPVAPAPQPASPRSNSLSSSMGHQASIGSQPQSLQNAVAGHRLRAQSSSTSSRPPSLSGSWGQFAGPQTNLIVNYIPVEVTDQEFRQLFDQFGEVESAKIVTDRTTGYSKGYGFVKYTSPQSAQDAMAALDGFAMYNKRLKVGLAVRQGKDDIGPAGSRIIVRDDPMSTSHGSSSLSQMPGMAYPRGANSSVSSTNAPLSTPPQSQLPYPVYVTNPGQQQQHPQAVVMQQGFYQPHQQFNQPMMPRSGPGQAQQVILVSPTTGQVLGPAPPQQPYR